MGKHVIVFILLLLSGIHSCKKEEISAWDFEENLQVNMYEVIDGSRRTLVLRCLTETIFPCINYHIQSAYKVSRNKIVIDFIQILKPEICLTALGPASTLIELNDLPNNVYTLECNFGSTKVVGEINVAANIFTVDLPQQTRIKFLNPNLSRVPENTIYGTVHYHSAITVPLVEKFLDSLKFYGATTALFPEGDYISFQIEANGQIKQTQDEGYYFTRYYIFHYTNASEQLRNLVSRFGINHGNDLSITLHTARGETFYSWML